MPLSPEAVNSYIRSRKTTPPDLFTGGSIPRSIIEALLENANQAPTHKLTQPWRFKVFTGKGLQRLGSYLAEEYKKNTPSAQFSEAKYRKTQDKTLFSACVIVVVLKRSPEEKIPEWEEIAAVGAAVENLWLSLAAYGLGGYWSTPASIIGARDFLKLQADERCLGLFYLGYAAPSPVIRKRELVQEKTEWVEE